MNYPVWYLPAIGGGTLIALIAIVHVFISHFAVGGGLYLVCAERKGLLEKDQGILDFAKKHAKFFLLITVVMGAITGVGIWFIISLVSPAATSLLIHNFVFGWATEWVFFVVELVAAFVYFYTFGKMNPQTHQIVGLIYFISAWLSLFIINGIIGFMLTPGSWMQNHQFWSGLFNPSFLPALFFRTFVSLMFAGVYAFLTTAFLADRDLKFKMTRFSAKWVLISFLAALPSGYWYLTILPQEARVLVQGASPTIQTALQYGYYALICLTIGTLVLLIFKPSLHTKPVSVAVFVSAFIFMGAFEWTREASRRPYVISGVVYSNSIMSKDVEAVTKDGFLQNARWVAVRDVQEDNLMQAGHDIFKNQCYSCHSVRGLNNDIAQRTSSMDYDTLAGYIENMHEIRPFMPPFGGNDSERKALAYYIVKGIHGKSVSAQEKREERAGGRRIFEAHCMPCHTADLVKSRTVGMDRTKIRWALDNLNRLQKTMPDYRGTPEEKELLADYIFSLRSKEGDNI